MIDFEVTPNRPDWLGVQGIARDSARPMSGQVQHPKPGIPPTPGRYPSPVKVGTDAPQACPMFVGRYIRGVKNGPSPAWLQRLRAIGLRPRSALVDITNYIADDRGRPLHVYDAKKLQGTLGARVPPRKARTVQALTATSMVHARHGVIADDMACIGHRRRDGRRRDRRQRSHHRRLHRIAPISIRCARPHGAPARHLIRCALSVRARRRSRFCRAGARGCHSARA